MLKNTAYWGQLPWGACMWSNGAALAKEEKEFLPIGHIDSPIFDGLDKMKVKDTGQLSLFVGYIEEFVIKDEFVIFRSGLSAKEKVIVRERHVPISDSLDKFKIKEFPLVILLFNEVIEKIWIKEKRIRIDQFIYEPSGDFTEQEEKQVALPIFKVFITIEGQKIDITDDIVSISTIDKELPMRLGASHSLVSSDVTITLKNDDGKYSERRDGSIFYRKEYLGAPIEVWAGFRIEES